MYRAIFHASRLKPTCKINTPSPEAFWTSSRPPARPPRTEYHRPHLAYILKGENRSILWEEEICGICVYLPRSSCRMFFNTWA